MTLLVTGGTGQLGSAVSRLRPDAAIPGRGELDLADPGGIRPYLEAVRPEAIVNCAAYTAVDRAEEEEAPATIVNGSAVGAMAEYAAEAGIPLVTFSTDYVFDGHAAEPYVESSPTDPINAYGRSKLAGERAALAAHPGALVIRTSWVISGTHPNFVATMLRLAPERELRVVDDQQGCPTVAADLAAGALAALDAGATGLLHLTNQGVTTWYRLARAAVEIAGIDPERIRPCTTEEYPTPARRPPYSVLGSERLQDLGIAPLPHWEASLPGVVAGLQEEKR
jgi:dTDP-4-dehydrorhamnose reductase